MSALIVEDRLLIAMDLESMLAEIGVGVAGMVASAQEAIEFLARNSPDFAILDVHLGDETSEAVARLMIERGMPFVFATGYDDRSRIPADLATVPVMQKPFDRGYLLDSLRTIFA